MSVGHIARALEENNIPTVIIAVKAFESRMRMMSLPRVLLVPEVMGRPMGAPHDSARHSYILSQALDLLETATANASIQHLK